MNNKRCTFRKLAFAVAILFLILLHSQESWGGVFSAGEGVPETISVVPSDFPAPPGSYFVPDAGNSQIPSQLWIVPSTGGPPISTTTLGGTTLGGTFLPASFLNPPQDPFSPPQGTSGYVVANWPGGRNSTSSQLLLSNGFGFAPFGSSMPGILLTTPLLASFGPTIPFGPPPPTALLVTTQTGSVLAYDNNGNSSVFANTPLASTFGLAQAPATFGSLANAILVSDTNSGGIVAITQLGAVVNSFANIPLGPNQTGLRQMAFAPANFGAFANDLLVSVSGSENGGGSFGAVVALNSLGQEVGILQAGSATDPFDPRGLTFTPDGDLLVSDASDPILIFTASDFQPVGVPEPATLTLLAIGIMGMSGYGWRRGRLAV